MLWKQIIPPKVEAFVEDNADNNDDDNDDNNIMLSLWMKQPTWICFA